MPSVPEQALEWLDRVKGHTVTVVGENIIDQYIYVHPAGKSAKDNLVTFVADTSRYWTGGAGIIAKHLEALGADVTWCSSGMPVVKTRYVDPVFNQKVFSVADRESVATMETVAGGCEHLLVADFGHHRGTQNTLSQFKTVMCQSNSLNWGFNPVTKHLRADYVVCDEMELHLALQNRWDPVEVLVQQLAGIMQARLVAITLGHRGALLYERATQTFHEFPAHAKQVVDRMGAGDAFLAASAPLAALGAPAYIVGLVGSVAAGLHVEQEGNPALDREKLIARLKEL
mgnify:CR=1 FL=1